MIRVAVDLAAVVAGEVTIAGDEAHYLTRVRRVRVGEALQLFDGAGRTAAATIVRLTSNTVTVEAAAPVIAPPELPHITAMIPLIKGDRFDYCLEKLVEVGVDAIVVWQAERAVVKLDAERAATRLEKWRAAITAATRQAGRAHEATIDGVWPLQGPQGALARLTTQAPMARRVLLHTAGGVPVQQLAGEDAAAPMVIITGPEGGLAPNEVELLSSNGFVPGALGSRILRAETAPVVAVALVRATEAAAK
ncbi:MAG TPA: RsmE family RNA methyltransferase [Kofleriaceae bacterium]|nr:RsmE family RNA methyltransferase [Kofleriaceae bacterium]